jgi:transposase
LVGSQKRGVVAIFCYSGNFKTRSYSQERRLEILAAAAEGMGTQAIALRFGCSESWVRRVKQEYREQGKIGPSTTRKRIPEWHAERDRIRELTEQYPDQTLQELKDRLGTTLSRSTLCVALNEMRLALKKK